MNLNLGLLNTEFMVFGLALAVFFCDLFSADGTRKRWIGWIAAGGLGLILAWLLMQGSAPGGEEAKAFGGMFLGDGPARVFKVIFIAAALLTVLMSMDYLDEARIYWQGEYYFITLLVLLGMMFIASAGDLLTLYVALELNTIGFYVLVSMLKKEPLRASETGLKYLILGALSSGVLLYGISLLYGMTGTLSLSGDHSLTAALAKAADSPLLTAAIAMVLAGFAFKITLVPFHAWSPDVYQGAPTPITAFLSVGSKAAGFAALIRVFLVAFDAQTPEWTRLILGLAVATFILANVVALKQSNIKRLLAYSSIAQAAYLCIALMAENQGHPLPPGAEPGTHRGFYSLVYYLLVYVFTNMAAFTVASRVSAASGGSDEISAFKGLWKRAPVLGLVMMMAMFSLAGIPPFGGFFSKFYLYMAGIEAGYFILVTFAVFMSIVSLFYYLVVVKRMYLEAPEREGALTASLPVKISLAICSVMMVLMGVYPQPFLSWIKAALQL